MRIFAIILGPPRTCASERHTAGKLRLRRARSLPWLIYGVASKLCTLPCLPRCPGSLVTRNFRLRPRVFGPSASRVNSKSWATYNPCRGGKKDTEMYSAGVGGRGTFGKRGTVDIRIIFMRSLEKYRFLSGRVMRIFKNFSPQKEKS